MEQNKTIHVILFKSRNKDNKHLKDFKERSNSFISSKSYSELLPDFKAFVKKVLKGNYVECTYQ